MSEHPYFRLVAFDLDGTLLPYGEPPRPRVVEAIRRARERGLIVTLATGRAPSTARPYAHRLGITAPIICFQGGRVVDPESGESLYARTYPLALARAVLQYAQAMEEELDDGWAPLVYQGDEMYLTRLWLSEEEYREFFAPRWHVLSSFDELPERPVDKIIFVGDPKKLDALRPRLEERFRGLVEVVRSWDIFLEVTALGVTKGNALAWLARHLGIPRERVVAVGDADNDISMLRWAGLAIAMGHAPEEVKAVADVIAPPVEEDGAAWVIEYLLSE